MGEASNPGPTVGGDERWHVTGTRGVRIGEASPPGPWHKRRRRVVASSETSGSEPEATLLDALEQDLAGSPEVPAIQVEVGRHRRRRRVRSEGAGGAIHHDLTLVDSSDDDALFVVPAPARPSRRLVLVPEVDGTAQSIQDREWVEPAALVRLV